MKTQRHPRNRKYIIYRNAVRKKLSHGKKARRIKIWWISVLQFSNYVSRQKNREIDTLLSQYASPPSGCKVNMGAYYRRVRSLQSELVSLCFKLGETFPHAAANRVANLLVQLFPVSCNPWWPVMGILIHNFDVYLLTSKIEGGCRWNKQQRHADYHTKRLVCHRNYRCSHFSIIAQIRWQISLCKSCSQSRGSGRRFSLYLTRRWPTSAHLLEILDSWPDRMLTLFIQNATDTKHNRSPADSRQRPIQSDYTKHNVQLGPPVGCAIKNNTTH